MILAVVAAAWGADWSPPQRVTGLDGVATVPLTSGEPLYVAADSRPDVHDDAGNPVPLRPARGGWVIPADDVDRVLAFDRAVLVRHIDEQAQEYAWNVWELGAGHRAAALPPAGGPALAAGVRVRASAVDDPAVARLGAIADAAATRRLDFPSHAEVSGPRVRGPAVVTVRASPRAGVGPIDAGLQVDGVEVATLVGATRGAPRADRVGVPPGDHDVTLRAAPTTAADARIYRTRGWVARPWPRDRTGIAGAELDWLAGTRDPEAFRPWLEDPGPAGALARARFVAMAPPEAATDVLARWTGRGDADSATALADGALARADLDGALVAAAVRAAPAVSPLRLAPWLDRRRPRAVGVALLDLAAGVEGPDRALAIRRRATLDTRFGAPLTPIGGTIADLEPSDGPGAARVPVATPLTVQLPDLTPRWPVLRLEGVPGAVATVDGVRWSVDSRVSVALTPGPHTVEATRGRVWLVDPEVTDVPAVPTLTTWTLPAEFPVPGAGEPGVLRVAWAAEAGIAGSFDDGSPLALAPASTLVWREVPIPAGASRLTLSGRGRAAVLLPTPRTDRPAEPPSAAAPGPTDAGSARALGHPRLAEALEAIAAGRPASALRLVGTDPADLAVVQARLRLDWQRLSRFDDALGYVTLAVDDSGVVPLAARVVPDRAATVRLAADEGVIRVRAIEGHLEAQLGGRQFPLFPGVDALLPLTGVDDLTVTGDGVVTVSLGLPHPADVPLGVTVAPPRLGWEEAAARVVGPTDATRLPGGLGSFRARAGAVRSQHAVGDVPYAQGALELEFLRADDARWWHVEGWLHAPRDAGGLDLELGWRGDGWRGLLAVAAARAREHGSVQLDAHALRDWPIAADVSLRAEAFLRVTGSSKPTWLAVDPRAWTLWEQTHPVGAGAVVAAWARPWRDVRLEGGLRVEANAGPGALAARPYAMAAWLVDPRTSITAEARLRAVAPDASRPTGSLRPSGDLRFDRVLTASASQRWSVSVDAGWRPRDRWVGGVFLECLWSDERGTRDLRPDEDAFRALRATP